MRCVQVNDVSQIGQYRVFKNKKIGEGGYGKVFIAEKDNMRYAQLTIMQMVNHNNLVKMYDYIPKGKIIYVFMEFCEQGDLSGFIKLPGFGQLQEQLGLEVFISIMEGLKKLNDYNIIHRDIKPQNILSSQGVFKLSDFGLSKIVNDMDNQLITTYLGTPLYCSPQVLMAKPYTSKTDIWSFGVTLYQITFGHLPFQTNNLQELIRAINQGCIKKKKKIIIIILMLYIYMKRNIYKQVQI